MNILDLRTVLFSYVITNAVCVLVMGSLWGQNRKHSSAVGFWLAGFIMQLLAVLLIVLRGIVPDFVSIVIGDPLVIGGTLLLYIGLERYVGKPGPQLHNYILLAVFFFVHTYFTFVQPSLQARNLNFSLGLLVICSQCAWLMLRRVDAEWQPVVKEVGVIFAVYSLVSVVRFFIDLAVPSGNNLFKSDLYDTLVILTYQMLFIGLTFALFLMVNRRLFADLESELLERKRAEHEIERIASFPRLNPNPVLEVDSAGQVTFANDATHAALTSLGLTDLRSFLPADIDELLLNLPLGAPAAYQREITLAGRFFMEALYFSPASNSLHIYANDITERRRAEEVTRHTQMLLNDTQLITKVGGWEYDLSMNRITWTDEVYRIYGLSKDYDPSNPDTDSHLFAPGDQEIISEAFRHAVDTGEAYDLELQLIKATGENIWVRTIGQAESRNGKILRVFGNIMDITERQHMVMQIQAAHTELKRLLTESEHSRHALLSVVEDQKESEEHILRLNTELEQRVADRTSQLEASNKELEAFAYSVSHDLRAPLRAVDGFSRILQQEYTQKLDEEGRRLLGVIRSSTARMDHLITDLLALSRVSRSQLNYSPIDMTAMADSMYHEIADPAVLQKFVFKVAGLPRVSGDPTLMRQVWSNLISNAIKFTLPKDECRIEIGGYEKDGVCTYSIRDSGVGFNPKYTDKLFGLFQRLHKESEFEGTGVGLAIVQRIVHRHGGQAWAESEVSIGATFYFSIPQRQVSHE